MRRLSNFLLPTASLVIPCTAVWRLYQIGAPDARPVATLSQTFADVLGATYTVTFFYEGVAPAGAEKRTVMKGGVGHNLPQEAPQAFAEAVVDVDGY
jgi:hypothetical protein